MMYPQPGPQLGDAEFVGLSLKPPKIIRKAATAVKKNVTLKNVAKVAVVGAGAVGGALVAKKALDALANRNKPKPPALPPAPVVEAPIVQAAPEPAIAPAAEHAPPPLVETARKPDGRPQLAVLKGGQAAPPKSKPAAKPTPKPKPAKPVAQIQPVPQPPPVFIPKGGKPVSPLATAPRLDTIQPAPVATPTPKAVSLLDRAKAVAQSAQASGILTAGGVFRSPPPTPNDAAQLVKDTPRGKKKDESKSILDRAKLAAKRIADQAARGAAGAGGQQAAQEIQQVATATRAVAQETASGGPIGEQRQDMQKYLLMGGLGLLALTMMKK